MMKQFNYLKHYYFNFIKTFLKKRFLEPIYNGDRVTIKKIGVVFFIPKTSPRYTTWNDGFVDAIKQLGNDFNIEMVNIADGNITEPYLNSFDFLLVKSNWNWGPDKLLREKFRSLKVKKGLAIAGVAIPPSLSEMMYYDVLWYETNWYRRILLNHPNTYHGFGINKKSLIPVPSDIKYNYITIGAFSPIKRMELVQKLKDKILVIGEDVSTQSSVVVSELKANKNVEIKPFVKYEDLPKYFSQAKTLYIPATIFGGGERAILEARHCGLNVKIEKDNPKLRELLTSPIWDSTYYYKQLKKGITSISK